MPKTAFQCPVAMELRRAEEALREFAEKPGNLGVWLVLTKAHPPLERMAVTVADCADGTVGLMLDSPDGLTTLLLGLDFRNERVEFSLAHGIATEDDGTRRAALDHASVLRFRRLYVGNGCLEVWTQGRRISRKDAYLPENIDLGATDASYKQMIAQTDAIAAQRQP